MRNITPKTAGKYYTKQRVQIALYNVISPWHHWAWEVSTNRPIVQQLRFPSIDFYLAAPWTGFPEFSPHESQLTPENRPGPERKLI